MARTSRRSAPRAGVVDPRDEPSAEWGWHGSFPNATRIAGVVSAIILLLSLIGPYQTHLQDFWVIPLALGMLLAIGYGAVKRRNDWRK